MQKIVASLVPRAVSVWEWHVMRLLFAPLVLWDLRLAKLYKFDSIKDPVGIAELGVPLTWLSQEWVYPGILYLVGALLIFYIWGRGLTVVLPLITLISIMVRTLENSQGAIHHSHQIIALVLLAQTVVVWWLRMRQWREKDRLPLPVASYQIYYSQAIIAASYVTAALSKLFNSNGLWVLNSPYLAFDLVKSKRQIFYKNLDPTFAGPPELALWVIEHPMISRVAFGGAFFLELFALISLAGRKWALFIGLSLIALHRGIFLLMSLKFFNNELMALIFLVNLPFWFVLLFSKKKAA